MQAGNPYGMTACLPACVSLDALDQRISGRSAFQAVVLSGLSKNDARSNCAHCGVTAPVEAKIIFRDKTIWKLNEEEGLSFQSAVAGDETFDAPNEPDDFCTHAPQKLGQWTPWVPGNL